MGLPKNKRRDFMRVHEISSIGKVTLAAFSFYVIIEEMEKAISIVIFSASQRRCSTFIFTIRQNPKPVF